MCLARRLRSGIFKMSAPTSPSRSSLSTAAAVASVPDNAAVEKSQPSPVAANESTHLKPGSQSTTSPSTSRASGKLYSGVFGLNKPAGISSAQALRDLQEAFNPSRMFAASIAHAQDKAERDAMRGRHGGRGGGAKKAGEKARRHAAKVKLGHGGTLDPMATGVLIVGVYGGTKALGSFLACSKEYSTTMLFGAASDTYDVEGKIVARAPTAHLTRAAVEAALAERFPVGELEQQPPVYSALRMDGKRLYEYAREGKPLPRAIEKRPTRVDSLTLTEWLEPGTHPYRWPTRQEAPAEAKWLAEQAMHLKDEVPGVSIEGEGEVADETSQQAGAGEKRKRVDDNDSSKETVATEATGEAKKDDAEAAEPPTKKAREDDGEGGISGAGTSVSASGNAPAPAPAPTSEDAATASAAVSAAESPPAARLDMQVASGFYVRSLCHDLGLAVGSLGMMATLVRTRQGDFTLGEGGNVLEYDDIARGEGVWGPKVERMLEAWQEGQEKR